MLASPGGGAYTPPPLPPPTVSGPGYNPSTAGLGSPATGTTFVSVGGAPTTLPQVAGGGGPGGPSTTPTSTTPPAPPSSPQNQIASDPVYQQALAAYNAALANASGTLDANLNQALINYGAVPDLNSIGQALGLSPAQISALTGGVGSGTAALAGQYTQAGDSVLGQLNLQNQHALDALKASLAARGTLESGATGIGVGLQNQAYQQAQSKAYQALIQQLTGFEDAYGNASSGAQNALVTAANNAYDRALQNAVKYPQGGSSTPPPPPPTVPSTPYTPPAPGTTSGAIIGGVQKNPYQVAQMFG